ncbi:hypothetical protein FQA39_LY05934 [Lamprigera yunnana]|nr:hypothetical protein FQA39_LY05934 [Lamprigera yunnana]
MSTLCGKKTIHSQAREIVYNNFNYMITLFPNESKQEIKQRVHACSGVSVRTIERIMKEASMTAAENNGQSVFTSPKSRGIKTGVISRLPDYDINHIRNIVYNFHKSEGCRASVDNLQGKLANELQWAGKRTTLYKLLKGALVDTHKKMYVCEDHFSDDCWYSSEKKKLKKFAIPSRFSASLTSVKVVSEHDYCLACVSDVSPHTPNVRQPVKCNNTVDNNCHAKNITDCLNNSVEEVIPEITTKINNGGILRNISATRTSQLSPRKRKMYYMNRTQQSRMLKLKHRLNASRDMCRSLKNCSYVNLLDDISINLNPVGAAFLRSQFENLKKHKPSWSLEP